MEQPATLIDSSVFPAIEEQPSNDIKMTIQDVYNNTQNESIVDIEPQDANREVSISQSKV